MNINKAIGCILGSLAMGALVATPSFASGAQATFATVSGQGPATGAGSNVFAFSGGSTGTFSTTPGAVFLASTTDGTFIDPSATLTFFGLSATGTATGTGTVTNPYTESLSGGSFALVKGTTTLLSGTFGSSNVLEAFTTGSAATITDTLNDVVYTSGTEYFVESGLQNPGSFSLSMTSVHPTPGLDSSGYLTAFKAGGTGTFSAKTPLPTPEPATVAPFVLGGLGLLGLAFRARKTRRTNGAAA